MHRFYRKTYAFYGFFPLNLTMDKELQPTY